MIERLHRSPAKLAGPRTIASAEGPAVLSQVSDETYSFGVIV